MRSCDGEGWIEDGLGGVVTIAEAGLPKGTATDDKIRPVLAEV